MSQHHPLLPNDQTPREELWNTITHALGVILALVFIPVLVYVAATRGKPVHIWGVSIFSASLVIMYLASTIYHAVSHPRLKRVMHILDHIGIFYLIAGSYTPFILFFMDGEMATWSLAIIWGIALLGTIYKLFFTGRFTYLSTALYLGMGWIVVFIGKPIFEGMNPEGLIWLFIGGGAYTVGVLFFLMKNMRFSHAIWHLFVLAGSVSHFLAVWLSVG